METQALEANARFWLRQRQLEIEFSGSVGIRQVSTPKEPVTDDR